MCWPRLDPTNSSTTLRHLAVAFKIPIHAEKMATFISDRGALTDLVGIDEQYLRRNWIMYSQFDEPFALNLGRNSQSHRSPL